MYQEDSSYEDIDEYQTADSIDSNMRMNDDDDGKLNDCLKAIVTNAMITAMDRKRSNAVFNIASSLENVTLSQREPKTNSQKIARMWGIGIDKAKKVISTTNQRAVCNILWP